MRRSYYQFLYQNGKNRIKRFVLGFLVFSSVRHNNWFGTGTYAEVNMSFPDAASLGAERLVLQYKNGDGTWTNFLNNETEIVTTGNNFSLVTLDESMFLTGVMAPWVGRGLQVSYIVNKLSDNSLVQSGLTYQWYRINPQSL